MLKVLCRLEGVGACLTQPGESNKASRGTIWKDEQKTAKWEKRVDSRQRGRLVGRSQNANGFWLNARYS